jgi:stage II sporulation protein D
MIRFFLKTFFYVFLLVYFSCTNTDNVKKKWNPPETKPWKKVRVRLDTLLKGGIGIKAKKGYFERQGTREDFVNGISMEALFLLENEPVKILSEDNIFFYKNREYRGSIELLKRGKTVNVINLVSLEDYLFSVVPSEMPASWEMEALKAQAVAARTYALHNILHPKFLDYHLEADVSSQMYSGKMREHPSSTKAVLATKGIVMIYEDQLVQAFYHSNSGGVTEIPEMVWGMKLDYMKSIASIYCMKTENLAWEVRLTPHFLIEKFALRIGKIQDISILERSPSGRARKLLIKGSEGEKELLGQEFRMSVGGVKVRSLLFDIEKTPTDFKLTGKGFGHGVGMSQWGSFNMAKEGKTYEDILKFYYTGVELVVLPD